MKNEITIRLGMLDDINELVQFMLDMAFETEQLELNETVLFKGIQNCLRDPNKGCYYIAEVDHKAVACLMTTYEWSDWRNTWVLWIQSVYVKPEFRRKGIYKKMYDHIVDICNNRIDYAGIRLYVDKSNHSAIKTYKDLGMNGEHYQVFEKNERIVQLIKLSGKRNQPSLKAWLNCLKTTSKQIKYLQLE